MKLINIGGDIELLWETGVYDALENRAKEITPTPAKGFDVWNARIRRKIVRGERDGMSVTRSIYRDADAWRVFESTEIKSEHFFAAVERWYEWAYDPSKPYPYTTYTPGTVDCNSVWDELDGEDIGLTLKGSLAHFLTFAKLDRNVADAIIDHCENEAEIDKTDAMLARLTI